MQRIFPYRLTTPAIFVSLVFTVFTTVEPVFGFGTEQPSLCIKIHDSTTGQPISICHAIHQSYLLTKELHGIDGKIQLLQDARISANLRATIWGTGMIDLLNPESDLRKAFKDFPPLKTVLRILDSKEKVASSQAYDAALAYLREEKLYGSENTTFLLTLDQNRGAGTYDGDITYFLEIVNGKMQNLSYRDSQTDKTGKIVLTSSDKTAWKIVESKDGNNKDILSISCRPDWNNFDLSSNDFLIYFTRFHFDGKNWTRFERKEKGIWKNESGFPDPSLFP